jgi:hypothetical protein
MKKKSLSLPTHLQKHLDRLHLKALLITNEQNEIQYVLGGLNYVKVFKKENQLRTAANNIFLQFFCEYMQNRSDIKISIIDKILWFIDDTDLHLSISKAELNLESLIKCWYRHRKRISKLVR